MIKDQIKEVIGELPENTRLVAVSKYHPVEAIQEAYDAGQRDFGESHVQELNRKKDVLPSDIRWHFIGHLQTNKVKYLAPYVYLIHSVDTLRLLCEIDRQAARCNRVIDCLLEVHIAQEETKFGFAPSDIESILQDETYLSLQHVRVVGLMCMASHTDDEVEIRKEFREIHELFVHVKKTFFADKPFFCELSMGMSHDYQIAAEEGSTLVRVGTKIFGERVY